MGAFSAEISFIQVSETVPPRDQIIEAAPGIVIADSPSTVMVDGHIGVVVSPDGAVAITPDISVTGDIIISVSPGNAVAVSEDTEANVYSGLVDVNPDAVEADSPTSIAVMSVVPVAPGSSVGATPYINVSAHKTIIGVESGTAYALSGNTGAFVISEPPVIDGIGVKIIPGSAVGVDTGLFAAITVNVDPAAVLVGSASSIAAVSFGIDFTRTLILFNFYITDDGPTITVPISSFQLVLYADKNAYLEVVVPGLQWIDEIDARKNGNLSLKLAYASISTLETLQEEQIVKVPMEIVDVHRGSSKQSITLSGHETESQALRRQSSPKTINLGDSWYSYKKMSGGQINARLAKPHMYLQAGDTIVDDDAEFVADRITWVKSERYHHMELSGAAI